LDQRAAKRREQARKEEEKIRASVADEVEEILARAHNAATEIISAARQRIPSTVGPPNPAFAGEEAKRAVQHLMD
jgi:F0F1-type ATP synthase membrane subunit b/b'